MEDFVACWWCYQPQSVCRRADPEAAGAGDGDGIAMCRYPDLVMPACFRLFYRVGRNQWLQKHFGESVTFWHVEEYMAWLGTTASLGGSPCIQANRVTAALLAELFHPE